MKAPSDSVTKAKNPGAFSWSCSHELWATWAPMSLSDGRKSCPAAGGQRKCDPRSSKSECARNSPIHETSSACDVTYVSRPELFTRWCMRSLFADEYRAMWDCCKSPVLHFWPLVHMDSRSRAPPRRSVTPRRSMPPHLQNCSKMTWKDQPARQTWLCQYGQGLWSRMQQQNMAYDLQMILPRETIF